MGYYLQAFICKVHDTIAITKKFDKAKTIEIGQELSLIPMTEELFNQINNFTISNSINQFEFLTENIETTILKHIADKQFAYIEAEYFGGKGGQIAIVWTNNKRNVIFEYGVDSINKALKIFGIKSKIGEDEFNTLSLGRYRNTSEWISH